MDPRRQEEEREAKNIISYMDSWQGTWTHIPCQSLYSPEPPGEGEYTLWQGIW
jgi:hypothetical protein